MKNFSYLVIVLTFFSSCSIEPQPINYGSDACAFCSMNIVDSQHAAELVTKKGKAYKYDAIECMMNYLNRNDLPVSSMELLLLTDYSQPGVLIDATKATYIRSEAVPSPMGGFLSGFEKSDDAKEIVNSKGGEVFDWNSLKERYKVK